MAVNQEMIGAIERIVNKHHSCTIDILAFAEIKRALADRDRLRAENEALKVEMQKRALEELAADGQYQEALAAKDAEIERLKAHGVELVKDIESRNLDWSQQSCEQQFTIDRLRKAMEKAIADLEDSGHADIQDELRQALAGGDGKGGGENGVD